MKPRFFASALAFVLYAVCSQAFGAVTTYNDRPTYLAAATPLGTTTNVDFSTYDSGSFITPGQDIYIDPLNLRDVTFAAQSYYNDKIYTFPNATYPVTLPANTRAFGMDLAGFYATTGIFTITLSTGDVYTLPFSSSGPYLFEDPIFFGAVSDTPIHWATIHLDSGYHMMDNFTFTRANADNCPSTHNPTQVDTDNDNIGDACDTDGLVSHWTGNQNSNDAFDGNHGTVQGTVNYAPGYSSHAFGLNGAGGGYVSVPDSPSLSMTGSFTLGAWIKINTNSVQQAIIEKYDVPGYNGYGLRIYAGKLTAFICDPFTSDPWLIGSTTVSTGVWHHAAFVYDGASVKLYLDGVLDASSPTTKVPTDGTTSLKIGARGDDANTRLNGLIDEAKIFNRALSATEVAGLFGTTIDGDGDGVMDTIDNCPLVSNPDQLDTDGDGAGNSCDADDDNDGHPDGSDKCPLVPNPDQIDRDGDGIGDACDPDNDNDSVPDVTDNCPLAPNVDQANNDGDALGDVCDPDDDNDGVLDGNDNCQLIQNAGQADSDSDGIGDSCDTADGCMGIAPPANLKAWWPGDGNAQDIIGGNHGTLHNNISYAPGKVGQAFSIDRSGGYVQMPDSNSLDIIGQITVDAWVRTDDPFRNGRVVDKRGVGGTGYMLHLRDGQLVFEAGNANATSSSVNPFIPPFTLVHLAATYDGTRIVLYVNGNVAPSGTGGGGPILTNSLPLRIGADQTGAPSFVGLIDEVEIFDRVLSQPEILALYRAGTSGKCKDSDGDGANDNADNCPLTANPDQTDTDGDGQGDACDPDDDNDGDLDAADNCQLTPNADQANNDGDALGDACDPDDDNDGGGDGGDNCPLNANADQTDTDGDGSGNACDADDDGDGVTDTADNCQLTPNPDQANNDGDALGDACDPDDDNDGVADAVDNCPMTLNSDQSDNDSDGTGDACDPDDDNDGVPDGTDNCQFTANSNQANNDGDSMGDVCDPDDDNDGVPDGADNCPLTANSDQTDTDGDGSGNACDADDDNDGVPDGADNCQFTSNPNQANNDGDALGDACDPDDDNDGVPDGTDNCQFTANPDQRDTNGDGVGDLCTLFQYTTGGQFVIGDLVSNAGGTTVNFWGSQWSQNNPMSGGSAPNAFKGFENGLALPACGSTWTSQPGNSLSPPATIPQFMAVIVSSSITKNGSVISGNVRRIVIVKTDPGYGPSPGHRGNGKVVAILCGAP